MSVRTLAVGSTTVCGRIRDEGITRFSTEVADEVSRQGMRRASNFSRGHGTIDLARQGVAMPMRHGDCGQLGSAPNPFGEGERR